MIFLEERKMASTNTYFSGRARKEGALSAILIRLLQYCSLYRFFDSYPSLTQPTGRTAPTDYRTCVAGSVF
jgi:hypothetical protein